MNRRRDENCNSFIIGYPNCLNHELEGLDEKAEQIRRMGIQMGRPCLVLVNTWWEGGARFFVSTSASFATVRRLEMHPTI